MFLRIKLKVLAFILLAFAWSAPAQSLSQYQVTPLQTAATATGNGTTMATSALGAVSVQITGTFSATVTFEGTLDGSTWVALMATNANDDARATTATAAGVYSVVLNGCISFRARISSYSSGSVTVKARLGNGVISRTSSGGGGGTGADPTATIGLSAVNGVASTFLRSDGAPALNQGITPTWTGAHLWSGVTGTFRRNSIGATSTDGLILENATAAAAGAQQYSPRLRLTGQGWKTNATAASQTVDWIFENQPVQGTANPTTNLVINSQINGAGYVPAVTIKSNDTVSNGSRIVLNLANSALGIGWSDVYTPALFEGGSLMALWRLGYGLAVEDLSVKAGGYLRFGQTLTVGNYPTVGTSAFISGSANAFKLGPADAASPSTQTLGVQGGSGSNIAGADWYRDASRGTGTGAGGAHVWRVAPAGSSGSSQNSLAERMRLDENGLKFPEIASATTPSANFVSIYAKDKSGTSALYVKNDAGTETEIGASGTPYTAPPTVSNWTWVNQGAATATDNANTIDLYAPNGSGDNLRMLVRSAPATPYTVTAAISVTMLGNDYAAAGFCWRESGSGEVVYAGSTHATTFTLGVNKYASSTSYDSTYFNNTYPPGDTLWIKASDDGTNRTVWISRTGTGWLQISQHSRTDFLTADQIGFFANSNQSTVTTGVLATLRSWSVQ